MPSFAGNGSGIPVRVSDLNLRIQKDSVKMSFRIRADRRAVRSGQYVVIVPRLMKDSFTWSVPGDYRTGTIGRDFPGQAHSFVETDGTSGSVLLEKQRCAAVFRYGTLPAMDGRCRTEPGGGQDNPRVRRVILLGRRLLKT